MVYFDETFSKMFVHYIAVMFLETWEHLVWRFERSSPFHFIFGWFKWWNVIL